ncbi:M48 family metallopeptidase [Natrialbaceae archaeon A-arb3/5]
MSGLTRARVGLWLRMAIASLLCVLLLGAVVGGSLLLVGVPAFGLVWYTVATLEAIVSVPLASTVAVAITLIALFAVELSLRTVRTARSDESRPVGPITEGIIELASYTLLLSSIVVVLASAPLVGSVLPPVVFALLVVLVFYYLLTISYVWVGREWLRSRGESDDGRGERSKAGNWLVVGVVMIGYLSAAVSELFVAVLVVALVAVAASAVVAPGLFETVRSRLVALAADDEDEAAAEPDWYGLTDETRRLAARLDRAPGPRPAVTTVVAVTAVLVASYAASTLVTTGVLAGVLAAACALALVGGHIGNVVRGEFGGDTAVLRDVESRTELASLEDATALDVDGAAIQATVARLAGQAAAPIPDVRLAESRSPAALTVGYRPSSSTIVLSSGLVDALDERELEAVLAHEVAHIANRDAAVLTALAAPGAVARVTTGRYGFNPILEPIAMLTSAVSRAYVAFVARGREYAADDGAVAITGEPAALASALEALDGDLERRPETDLREHRSAAAFSIVPPPWEDHRFFDRTRRFVARTLLGTHPSTATRIERLRSRVG